MTMRIPTTPNPSALRRTFFRGIYEIFSYLLPGFLLLYLFFTILSLAKRGWDEYLQILFSVSSISQENFVVVLAIIVMAYLAGHLSWPFRYVSRRTLYNSPTRDRIYSSLNKYFDMCVDDQPLHEKLISDIEEFTGIPGIPRVTDSSCNHESCTRGYLPKDEITVRSKNNGQKMRRAYRIIDRFIEYTYPEFYHRGYERYQGLRRFWENIFAISVAFCILSILAIFYSGPSIQILIVLSTCLLVSITSVFRLRVLMLSPYREVFILFHLHQRDQLPRQINQDRE